tara:strand:+ start:1832 stop:2059 length:228 start_codon:yes stop_codon:yes gene_type:complete
MNPESRRITIQTVIDEETLLQLDRLMMVEALENNTRISTLSKWVRNLIEDTVNFQPNQDKIESWDPKIIKKLKNK